jgi:hypothetical protein
MPRSVSSTNAATCYRRSRDGPKLGSATPCSVPGICRQKPVILHRAVPALVISEVGRVDRAGSRDGAYQWFLEWIVSRVPVPALLQRGYSHQRNVRKCTDET